MATVIETTGKTIEEAIQAAVSQLGVKKTDLEVEVLETPTKKIFGLFGGTPAKIRATLKEPPPPAEPAPPVEVAAEPPPVEPQPVEPAPVEVPEEKFEPVLEPSSAEVSEPLNREQLIDAAENFLQDVFAAMDLEVAIDVEEFDDDIQLNLSGKSLGVLIGRRGQALDALQYLLNLSVNRKREDEKIHFTLDVEDYRRRREVALTKLAKGVAERAIKTRRDVRLEPMNRHERKIIHTVLQDNNRVETHSTGEEPYRYVIVTPVKRGRR